MAANAVLKVYATKGQLAVLIGALLLFCLGNWLMVQVMRLNGLGLAIALSAIFQLVAISVMAIFVFGERPTGLQTGRDGAGLRGGGDDRLADGGEGMMLSSCPLTLSLSHEGEGSALSGQVRAMIKAPTSPRLGEGRGGAWA